MDGSAGPRRQPSRSGIETVRSWVSLASPVTSPAKKNVNKRCSIPEPASRLHPSPSTPHPRGAMRHSTSNDDEPGSSAPEEFARLLARLRESEQKYRSIFE